MTNYEEQAAPNPIKTISIIHLALLIGQLLFAVIVFSISKEKFFAFDVNDVFLIVAIILAVSSFFVSGLLFRKLLDKAKSPTVLREKITLYQTALITRCALLEGASLFGIVVFSSTGNLVYLFISGLIILYFIFIRPTKDKIAEDLELSYEEKMAL